MDWCAWVSVGVGWCPLVRGLASLVFCIPSFAVCTAFALGIRTAACRVLGPSGLSRPWERAGCESRQEGANLGRRVRISAGGCESRQEGVNLGRRVRISAGGCESRQEGVRDHVPLPLPRPARVSANGTGRRTPHPQVQTWGRPRPNGLPREQLDWAPPELLSSVGGLGLSHR
jgi:hypothetical protein